MKQQLEQRHSILMMKLIQELYLLKETISIEKNETSGSLHDKLAPLGAKLILKTLDHIMAERNAVQQKLTGE